MRLRVNGTDASLRSSCLRDEHDVFLPLDSLSAFGVTWRVSQRGDSVLVTRAGQRTPTEIALAKPGRDPMVPVSALTQVLGLEWSVSDGVCTVRPRGSAAPPRATATTPAPAAVQKPESPDTPAPAVSRAAVQPSGSIEHGDAGAVPDARLKVNSTNRVEPVQPVVHVDPAQRARAVQQPDSLDSSGPHPATAPTAPVATQPPTPAAGVVAPAVSPGKTAVTRITEVVFEPLDEGHAQIHIRGDGKLAASAHILTNPSRLAIDVPRAIVDAGQSEWRVQHPFLSTIRSAGETGGVAQIVLDLARLVSYRVLGGQNAITVQLALPKGVGRRMKDLIVAIDPGHGGPKTGCGATIDGKHINEKDLTLSIGKLTASMLEEAGAHVVMTRTDDSDIPLKARPAAAAANSADLFISIHIDDCPGAPAASGTTVYYHGNDGDSRSLAISLSGRIAQVSGLPARGAVSDLRRFVTGMAVLRYSVMPATLIEVGYISNPGDRRKIASHEFQLRIAQAIVDGVRGYAEGYLPEHPLPPVEGWTR